MMKRTNKKMVAAIVLVGMMSTGLMACKPYNAPEFVEVSPSQTAFMIPLTGDAANQVKMSSEEEAAKNLVNSKRVTIPKEWIQTGRGVIFEDGSYMPTSRVILVERKPETREWTEDGTGTSVANQGIKAESKESIAFMARMNVTASIQESDASKYLFNYNDKTLASVMDTELRAMVESKFVQECAKRNMATILVEKEQIMDAVREEITTNFTKKGVTLTQIGLKGDLTYTNPNVQTSIDANFTAVKQQEAQTVINETNKSKAIADAEVIRTQASTMGDTIKLKEAEARIIDAQAKLEMAKSIGNMKDVKVLGDNAIMGDILK